MKYEFHKSPWFLLLVAFVIWGCGYITADDIRIERENGTREKSSCQLVYKQVEK